MKIIKTFIGCITVMFMIANTYCYGQEYTVEEINDVDIIKYPPPVPTNVRIHSFSVSENSHNEEIDVNSTNLRNLSITIENTGEGLIKSPHLFGSQGWDYRGNKKAFKSLATTITQGNLTKEQKFFRAFEFASMHVNRAEVTPVRPWPTPYPKRYNNGNSSRILNGYGSIQCGPFHDMVSPILVSIPDAEMHGAKYLLDGHTAGGAYWDGKWHDYNGSPTFQILHYKMDGKTIATWADLKKDHSPIDSIQKHLGVKGYFGKCFNLDSPECPIKRTEYPPEFYDSDYLLNFKYSDLRPEEKMKMNFDMKGRYDTTSVSYTTRNGRFPRNWVDYGSVVYTYKPNFYKDLYEPYVVEKSNVQRTKDGLVPVDPSKPSFIVFASKHYPWYHVGANFKAWFKTKGEVYIAKNKTIPKENLGADTLYTNLSWAKLDVAKKEYDSSSITAKSAFWVKFTFKGKGSGIDSLEISSELQMSPGAMPKLNYGKNNIRFEAKDMNGSTAKITYDYDDKSPYYFYEPATSNTGKHIYHRLGGQLQKGYGLWKKSDFWVRLKDSADVTSKITVKILNVQNTANITTVRTLFTDKPLKWGYYWWYWDGKDDEGNLLPGGMYAYKIEDSRTNSVVHAAQTYLYPDGIWPIPNEQRANRLQNNEK